MKTVVRGANGEIGDGAGRRDGHGQMHQIYQPCVGAGDARQVQVTLGVVSLIDGCSMKGWRD